LVNYIVSICVSSTFLWCHKPISSNVISHMTFTAQMIGSNKIVSVHSFTAEQLIANAQHSFRYYRPPRCRLCCLQLTSDCRDFLESTTHCCQLWL